VPWLVVAVVRCCDSGPLVAHSSYLDSNGGQEVNRESIIAQEAMNAIMNTLSPTQIAVIELRVGFAVGKGKSRGTYSNKAV
jgi:hypothetical protein